MPFAALDRSPSADSGSSFGLKTFDDPTPLSPVMLELEGDDVGALLPSSPAPPRKPAVVKEKLFYARSEGGSSDAGHSPARSAAGPLSPAVQHGAPMTARGKARLAGAPVSSPPPKLKTIRSPVKVKSSAPLIKGKKPAAPPKPNVKAARKAAPASEAHLGRASRGGETDKVSFMFEGRFETIRRGADGLFACKSCVVFSTNFADKMRAHFERCVKGQSLDSPPSDASEPSSVEEVSQDEYSSAAEPDDDDFQTVVKTTARSTGRRKGPAAAVKVENGGGVKTKKLAGPKAVGIAGGSRVDKLDRKADKKPAQRKSSARSPSPPPPLSVSPKKRKAPAAQPIPMTRAARAVKAEGARSHTNGKAAASSSATTVALFEGDPSDDDDDDDRIATVEPKLRLRVVKINDERERFLVDEKGSYWCQHCRVFTSKTAAHIIDHRKGGFCQAKLKRK